MISWQQRFQIHGDQTHLSPIHFHQSCRRPLLLAHEPMVRSPSLFHSTRHFFTSSERSEGSGWADGAPPAPPDPSLTLGMTCYSSEQQALVTASAMSSTASVLVMICSDSRTRSR